MAARGYLLRSPRMGGTHGSPRLPRLGLSVAFVGELAFSQLSSGVRSVLIRRASADSLGGNLAGQPEVVVIDAEPPGFDQPAVERLTGEARNLGASIVGIHGPAGTEPIWDGLVDLELGLGRDGAAATALPFVPPVDPLLFNPCDFPQVPEKRFAVVVSPEATAAELSSALGAIRDAAADPTDVFLPGGAADVGLPSGMEPIREALGAPALARRLKPYRGVLGHPGLHPDPRTEAALIVRLAASGIPTALVDRRREFLDLLSPELRDALAAVSIQDLRDRHARELVSVRLRRAALKCHSGVATWRTIAEALGRSVEQPARLSVLLATKRPNFLEPAIRQVNRQSYQPRELIVVLHGDDFSPDVAETLEHQVEGPLSIVRADGRLPLGDALNLGVEAARGELIVKMDDDDWYAEDHLWDLVLAHEYSGAALVGKAAEFLFLADLGITIRRFARDAETSDRRITSGALLVHRDTLIEVGGWAAVRRREQAPLISAIVGASHRVHRTHGFGYLMNRHGTGHTWNPEVDYFLLHSERQWRGAAFEAAGLDR